MKQNKIKKGKIDNHAETTTTTTTKKKKKKKKWRGKIREKMRHGEPRMTNHDQGHDICVYIYRI